MVLDSSQLILQLVDLEAQFNLFALLFVQFKAASTLHIVSCTLNLKLELVHLSSLEVVRLSNSCQLRVFVLVETLEEVNLLKRFSSVVLKGVQAGF